MSGVCEAVRMLKACNHQHPVYPGIEFEDLPRPSTDSSYSKSYTSLFLAADITFLRMKFLYRIDENMFLATKLNPWFKNFIEQKILYHFYYLECNYIKILELEC